MMMLKQPKHNLRKLAGVSLVEVMIAMLLGLMLMGGILQVFASSRQSYRVHDAVSRMQEGGRMALEIIARDVRMADFWGCLSEGGNVVNNLNNAGAGYIDFAAGGIGGTEGAAGAPDTLILRGGINSGLAVEPPYGPQASANIKVAAGNDLEQDDIVFVSDCSAGDIFQISNANPSGAGVLVHNTGNASPGNYNATNPGCPGGNAHCLSQIYGSDASVFSVQEITFTVAPGSEGQPALFRNGQEADQIIDMDSVISIRFAVVTRSYNDNLTGGLTQNYSVLGADVVAADSRLRQVYTSTVTVRNRL